MKEINLYKKDAITTNFLDSSPFAIAIFDLNYKYQYLNKAMARLTGVDLNKHIGKSVLEIDTKNGDKLLALLKKIKDEEQAILNIEFDSSEVLPALNENKIFEANFYPVTNQLDEIESIACTVVDITKLKETEKKLDELIKSKDMFVEVVSHDLLSYFNGILGFGNMLKENVQQKQFSRIDKHVNLLLNSSNKAFQMLKNLMQWLKVQTVDSELNKTEVILFDLIDTVADTLLPMAQLKMISLDIEGEKNLKVMTDKEMLATLMRNIISNAIKFSHQKTAVNIHLKTKDGGYQIMVQDQGIGMSNKDLKALFCPNSNYSHTGTNGENGSGFGLYICKKIVSKLNGKIWATSAIGSGSTFNIWLPLS